MKTEQQKRFEDLIMQLLEYVPYVQSRKEMLEDFKESSDIYYEIFCEQVYQLLEVPEHGSLLIDERGFSHSKDETFKKHHMYLEVLSEKDFDIDADDIIVYINEALNHLEEQIYVIQHGVKAIH